MLTHNTDLIRLLDGQYRRCFKLYLLNNTDGELNGFIPLKNNEQEMLISLEKLLTAFRESVPRHVVNRELFLISMIPFMRGYANIICNRPLFESLTQVMHGYKTEKVDIARAYTELFGAHPEHLPDSYEVSVTDILGKTVDGVHLLDTERFPLLDRTLRHSFVYLFLRLMVEKNLVEKFGIDTTRHEQLGQIISAAYPDENDVEQIRNRIRLTSKKTLINEFNHFEGNLSIFQPAIDSKILNEAGLISDYGAQYADNSLWSFGVGSLTWEGNDFLDKVRDNSQWKKIKDTITQKGLPLVIETIKTISSAFVTAAAEGVANSIIKNSGTPQ